MSDFSRRGATFRLLAALALYVSAVFPHARAYPAQEIRRSETLAPGIEHLEIRRGDLTDDPERDRWIIHVLLLDPRCSRLVLARAMDEVVGAETTSSLAARHGALAAVNGGYFRTTGTYRGEPTGLLVMERKVLSEPLGRRTALAISNAGERTRLASARFEVKAEVLVEGQKTYPVSGFNRPREENELIVFTPEFHRTTLTGPDGLEAVIEEGRIVTVSDGAGSQPIPGRGYVLSADGAARQWARDHLRAGIRIEIRSKITADPPLPFAADFIVGGGPLLVTGGKAATAAEAEQFDPDFIQKRHPRTAAGIRGDGIIVLVTVDGRQPKKSVGMTIQELAVLMTELGCVEAINLDGGGSTAMAINGRVVNNPSDATGERPVSDALLVFPRK
ncbi:MAG: phosphodiester glycosidase family protein [Candidatus Aminicenantes bacterium]|nr:phosphodiester glycosidase family protein [Candidatus Aminicenantes bacterium]